MDSNFTIKKSILFLDKSIFRENIKISLLTVINLWIFLLLLLVFVNRFIDLEISSLSNTFSPSSLKDFIHPEMLIPITWLMVSKLFNFLKITIEIGLGLGIDCIIYDSWEVSVLVCALKSVKDEKWVLSTFHGKASNLQSLHLLTHCSLFLFFWFAQI